MARYLVYRFGQFRLVPSERMLYCKDGSKSRISGKPFDLLVYLLDHAQLEIKSEFLCKGSWSDGVSLSSASLTQQFRKLYAVLKDDDRNNPIYIRRDDRSVWFLQRSELMEEGERLGSEEPDAINSPERDRAAGFDGGLRDAPASAEFAVKLSALPTLPINFVPRPTGLTYVVHYSVPRNRIQLHWSLMKGWEVSVKRCLRKHFVMTKSSKKHSRTVLFGLVSARS